MTLNGWKETKMVRAIDHGKNIACLESLWDKDIEHPFSVAPILELSSKINNVKFIHLSCNTIEELAHHLNLLKKRRGYGILYLAFHGKPGRIILNETPIDLEILADFMGKGFKNWVIHFGCCETMRVGKKKKMNFIKRTEASMVTGYRTEVDWINGTVMDLLLLNCLLPHKNLKKNWMIFKKLYRDLITFTGLDVYHKKLLKLGKHT
jgi:hypothetical protein